MKGNKMSAILAILLMLSGAFAVVPLVHSATTGTCTGFSGNVPVNPFQSTKTQADPNVPYPPITNVDFLIGTNGTAGTTFWADVDAYGVTGLSTFTVGFVYNPTLFTVLDVQNGSVLQQLPASKEISVPGDYSSFPGVCTAYGWSATGTLTFNGTGAQSAVDLMNVKFQINAVSPSYLSSIAGVPQQLMSFSYSNITYQALIEDGAGNVFTPPLGNVTVTYHKPGPGPVQPPTAKSTITPNPVTVGTAQVFDASTSLPGFNGTDSVPITAYDWDWGNGTHSSGVSVTNTFSAAGTYNVILTVYAVMQNNATSTYNMSDSDVQTANVFAKATGCAIDLYTQNWRYIDPFYIQTAFTAGLLSPNSLVADTFRPGDLVQLFADVTYNAAPVQGALVTFQVWDPLNNTVLVSTAISDCNGLVEWEFRIPWPSTEDLQMNNFTMYSVGPTENTTLFGTWKVSATWQLGSQYTELPPFEKTQVDTMWFDVSWGLSIYSITVDPAAAVRGPASCGYGDTVVVKVGVWNEYMEPVPGLLTATLYDELLVPIYPPAALATTFPVGDSGLLPLPGVPIPSYAFVGTGYAWVNLLSTWPSDLGTAYCPPAWCNFAILVHP